MDINIPELLKFGVRQGASDLHLSAGSIPMIRLHGKLVSLDMGVTTDANYVKHFMVFLHQIKSNDLKR